MTEAVGEWAVGVPATDTTAMSGHQLTAIRGLAMVHTRGVFMRLTVQMAAVTQGGALETGPLEAFMYTVVVTALCCNHLLCAHIHFSITPLFTFYFFELTAGWPFREIVLGELGQPAISVCPLCPTLQLMLLC